MLREESAFRHSGWAPQRRAVYDALMRTGQSNRRLQAFADCGGSLWLHSDGGELALTCNHCHDRLCVPCQAGRRAALVERLCVRCAEVEQRVRFVTLTLKCQPVPLVDQLDRLTASFRRLRQRKWWISRVVGGAAFLEVKLGRDSHQWHVHLHILCEGTFLDQRELSAEWHAVTGDSYITDVRALVDARSRAGYVAKYATKPLDGSVVNSPVHLDEAVVGLRGRRLFQCFGTWSALLPDDDAAPCTLTPIGNLSGLHADALRGDATARRWMEAALRKWPTLADAFPLPPTSTA